MSDFAGKNILVLGGSRGIGAAIVRRFAAGGGRVTFTYAGSHDAAEALAAETRSKTIRADSADRADVLSRSEEHTSELQSLMRLSYPVFCLQKKTPNNIH